MNVPMHHDRSQFRDTVREALLDRAEDLFADLIGKPVRAGGHDWRSRARNGFSMEMTGSRRGLWKNHTTGDQGDLLDLVALELLDLSKPYGQDFAKVLNAAAAWAGVTRNAPVDRTAQLARQVARDRDAKAQEQQQAQQRATLTKRIASKAQPITGSPAAAYLAGRGIVDLPRTGIAYLPAAPDLAGPGMASPKHPALTVWAYAIDGTLKGGQRILIDTAGRKASLPEDTNRKPAFAAIGGNPARFPARIDGGPLCVCEGPESALSVWQATGFETWAVFGVSGWESAPLPHGRKIILCPDRDAPVGTYPAGSKEAYSKESAARTFGKAVKSHLGKGVQVWIAEAPEPVGSKSDLNDTLQRAGNQAVAQAIAAAVDMTPPPFHPAPKGDRDAALAAHPATVRKFFADALPKAQARRAVVDGYADLDPFLSDAERTTAQGEIRQAVRNRFALDYTPSKTLTNKAKSPRVMLSGAQGVGKTTALLNELRAAVGIVSVVPMPDIGKAREAFADFDELDGLKPAAMVLLGRDQLEPDGSGVKMCQTPEAAKKVAQRGLSVRKMLCEGCPFAADCGHMRQEQTALALSKSERGVVFFAAHEYAFTGLPGNITPDLVAFDEEPRGKGAAVAFISFDDLATPLAFTGAGRAVSDTGKAAQAADAHAANLSTIQPLKVALRDAMQQTPDTALQTLAARGITPAVIDTALAALEYYQDESLKAEIQNVKVAYGFAEMQGKAFNLDAKMGGVIDSREVQSLTALRHVFEVLRIEMATGRTGINALQRVAPIGKPQGIEAHYLQRLAFSQHTPFLYLDGTGDHQTAQKVFGQMHLENHRAERHADVTIVTGNSFANGLIKGGTKANPYTDGWADYAAQFRADIVAYCAARPAALVIANKGVIDALLGAGLTNTTAHFNALRGKNTWETYQDIIVVGRELPPLSAVEGIARAFTADSPIPFQTAALNDKTQRPQWAKQKRALRMRDGSTQTVEVDAHPDPWAEIILRQIRDGEAMQALDRLRPMFIGTGTKTPEPVRMTLLCGLALDITVDRVEPWQQAKQGGNRAMQALESSKVLPMSGAEAARLFPALWNVSKTAARDLRSAADMVKSLMGHSLCNIILYGECPVKRLTLCHYRSAPKDGQRMRRHSALVDAQPHLARAVLEAVTGPLQVFELDPDWEAIVGEIDAADIRAAITQSSETAAPMPESRHTNAAMPESRHENAGNVAPLRRSTAPDIGQSFPKAGNRTASGGEP